MGYVPRGARKPTARLAGCSIAAIAAGNRATYPDFLQSATLAEEFGHPGAPLARSIPPRRALDRERNATARIPAWIRSSVTLAC